MPNLNERKNPKKKGLDVSGAKGKDGERDGGRRAITAMSSVTDLHRPLHSHSPWLLSVELLSSVAYH